MIYPVVVTQHADGTFNIYSDQGKESMADEILIAYGIKSQEDAEFIASAFNSKKNLDNMTSRLSKLFARPVPLNHHYNRPVSCAFCGADFEYTDDRHRPNCVWEQAQKAFSEFSSK